MFQYHHCWSGDKNKPLALSWKNEQMTDLWGFFQITFICLNWIFFWDAKHKIRLSWWFNQMSVWLVIRRWLMIPAGSSNILSWRLIMTYFLQSFSPFKKGSCQFLAKRCTQVLVNSLEDSACPGKVWLGKMTTQHDPNSVDWAVKLQLKQPNKRWTFS